ncbi:hypothetical protein [Novosphingobium sp. BL-52-GroH]|uniref:hypothetical protein n=1 Tax=Novosphingobium sp. BL-52-GroH TaxID=3349877 RepID=UPI00384E7A60
MQRLRTILFSVLLALPAASFAGEQDQPLRAQWTALAEQPGSQDWELTLGYPHYQRQIALIVPRTLYRLDVEATGIDGKKVGSEGLLLLGIENRPGTRCEPVLREKWNNFVCLVDANADGNFDHYFLSAGRSTIYQTGKASRLVALKSSVTLTPVDPRTMDTVKLNLNFIGTPGGFLGSAVNRFKICMSVWRPALLASGTWVVSCMPEFRVADSDFPATYNIMGRQITFVTRENKTAKLTVIFPAADVVF